MTLHSNIKPIYCITATENFNLSTEHSSILNASTVPEPILVSRLLVLVINLVESCYYFPPGLQLPSQPPRSPPFGEYQIVQVLFGDISPRTQQK